jgi:hypothetical protein
MSDQSSPAVVQCVREPAKPIVSPSVTAAAQREARPWSPCRTKSMSSAPVAGFQARTV